MGSQDIRKLSFDTLRTGILWNRMTADLFRPGNSWPGSILVISYSDSPPYGGGAKYEAPQHRIGAVPEDTVSLFQGPATLKGSWRVVHGRLARDSPIAGAVIYNSVTRNSDRMKLSKASRSCSAICIGVVCRLLNYLVWKRAKVLKLCSRQLVKKSTVSEWIS